MELLPFLSLNIYIYILQSICNFAWSTTTIGTCLLQHRYYMSVDVLHNQFTSQVPTYLVGSRCVISGTYIYDIQACSLSIFFKCYYMREKPEIIVQICHRRRTFVNLCICAFMYHTTTLLSSVFVFGKTKTNNHQ